jgi:ABC-type phosphate/phosphonate transport system substrate-binding protein
VLNFLSQTCFVGLLCVTACVTAQALTLGVNVGVSTKESPLEVERRYGAMTDGMTKALGQKIQLQPVPSNIVRGTLMGAKAPEVMIVHPHHAFEVGEKYGYRSIGWTKDQRNNRVYFLTAPNSGIKTLTDVRDKTIGITGRDSFATAMAKAELKASGVNYDKLNHYFTEHQDVAVFMLESGFAAVVTTRQDSTAESWRTKGNTVLQSAQTHPVYVLMIKRNLPPQVALSTIEYFRTVHTNPEAWEPLGRAGITSFEIPDQAGLGSFRKWLTQNN